MTFFTDPEKLNSKQRNQSKKVTAKIMPELIQTNTELKMQMPPQSKPESSVITSKNVMESTTQSTTPNHMNREKSSYQLPYLDHQYSQITFYGSQMSKEDAADKADNPIVKDEKINTPKKVRCVKSVVPKKMPTKTKQPTKKIQVIRPTPIIYHLQPNNGVQQLQPAYYMPNYIAPTFIQTPFTLQTNSNISAPMTFQQPITILQTSPHNFVQHQLIALDFCKQKPNETTEKLTSYKLD